MFSIDVVYPQHIFRPQLVECVDAELSVWSACCYGVTLVRTGAMLLICSLVFTKNSFNFT